MKKLILCADDYALAPGVSRGIRELAVLGRLNATSVMTPGPHLAAEARHLLDVVPESFQIGLHVTLTSGLKPLTRMIGPQYLKLPVLMARAFSRTLKTSAIATEIEAQFQAFHHAFGRPPAFVDGHQHVHLLPIIRDVVFAARHTHAPLAWLRQCTGPHGAGKGPKAKIIATLSRQLVIDAHRRNVPVNPAFSGAYPFIPAADFAALFPSFLRGMPDGALVMCHPGYVDSELKAVDPIHEEREIELEYFKTKIFTDLLEHEKFHL